MLKVEIIAIGKLSQPFIREGVGEYIKRVRPYYDLVITELPEYKPAGNSAADCLKVIEAEGARIQKALDSRKNPVTALTPEGSAMSSEEFAYSLTSSSDTGGRIFIIGGSLGLSDGVKKRAGTLLSLSAMTLPHQLARLVLLEQVYRAAAINFSLPYHK